MKIGIIKENKVPVDSRVPLTPEQCQQIKEQYPHIQIVVQTSDVRCFEDEEYHKLGFEIVEDMSDCDVLLGVKEVPKENLIVDKTYFFFSHTIKKQPYNRSLLQRILEKNIRLIDYELLTNQNNQRVIAFGRYAGLVGAYNGILTYGKRYNLFDLKPANQCFDMKEMQAEFSKVQLPSIKIVITGGGRVAKGAMEILDGMRIKKVSPESFLSKSYDEAVYTQLNSEDYNKMKDGSAFVKKTFYNHPEQFEKDFYKYAQISEILIACAYWHPQAPVLFTKDEMRQADFGIKVIADITCDIEGSIPSTKRPSTIADPIYDYNPQSEELENALSHEQNITVMAVDNLPCELPRDASRDFGNEMISNVLPYLFGEDSITMIERATIAQDGKLKPLYDYLQDYVDGK